MVIEKQQWRSYFRERLRNLNPQEKQTQSQGIVARLVDFLHPQKGVWTLFSPLQDEPNLLSLMDHCPHLKWAFPKVESKKDMAFYPIESSHELLTGPLGMGEPQRGERGPCAPDHITGAIVPGLAFDGWGTRLGRGGGFYDRFLESFRGLKLGVTFNQAISTEALPRKPHDQGMHIVVSPQAWIEVETKEVSYGL